MTPQTYSLWAALGSVETLEILLALLEEPGTVEEISRRTSIPSATSSRRLDMLGALGLVTRESARAPFKLTDPAGVRTLIESFTTLSQTILRARLDAESALQRRVRKTRLRAADPSSDSVDAT